MECAISSTIASLFVFTGEIPVRRHQMNDNCVRRVNVKSARNSVKSEKRRKKGNIVSRVKKLFRYGVRSYSCSYFLKVILAPLFLFFFLSNYLIYIIQTNKEHTI